LIDTAKDVQLFRLRDLFDDAASEYTGALIINGRAEGGETELPGSYSHDAPREMEMPRSSALARLSSGM